MPRLPASALRQCCRSGSSATASTTARRRSKPSHYDRAARRPDTRASAQDGRGASHGSSETVATLSAASRPCETRRRSSDILDAYLESEEFADKAPSPRQSTADGSSGTFARLLGKRHAHLVTEHDVRRAFAAIRDGKTAVDVKTGKRGRARVRGGTGAARMAIVVLAIILQLGNHAQGLLKENPAQHISSGASRHAGRHP